MFPVNVRLLLKVVIPHPNPHISLNDSHALVMGKSDICQSNACVTCSKCNTKVAMEEKVNLFNTLCSLQK